MVRKYCKKPATIDAIIYNGSNKVEIQGFVGCYLDENTIQKTLEILTPIGYMTVNVGDYVVKSEKGEFFSYNKNLFEKLYKEVDYD